MKRILHMKMQKTKYTFGLCVAIFLMVFAATTATAQSRIIQGSVTDNTGESLIGANLAVKGTTKGAITDIDGSYSIEVADNETIVFSYIGYESQEIVVGDQTTINVVLSSNTILDEVVVVGYGIQRKSDVTGAIASVSSEDFKKQPLFRIEDALAGRAAGVHVTKNSGAPGAGLKIRIRGANSINGNNQPLVVIDGIIGADLRSLNTNDIESMEILKDASATAIYGVRGANGVVLVTTKQGTDKPRVDVQYFKSFSQAPNKLDLLSPSEFAEINGIDLVGSGTDYQDEYFKSGVTNNLQASFSGKSDKISYYLSGSAVDQEGIDINSNYNRYSLRSNLKADFNDKFSAGLNIYGSSEKLHNLINNGARASTDRRAGIAAVIGWDPTTPVRNEDGLYNLTSVFATSLINPVAVRNESDVNTTVSTINTSLNLTYKILDNLSFSTIAGLIQVSGATESFTGIPAGTFVQPPRASANFSNSLSLQTSNILTWNKEMGKSNIKATGIYEISKIVRRGFNAGAQDIPGNFFAVQFGAQPRVGSFFSPRTLESFVGRLEYTFNRNFFATATLRRDGTSVFRDGNRIGYFPSAAIGYQFGDLLPDDSFIDGLKITAGYGVTGNQAVSPYSTYNSISSNPANFPINGVGEESVGIQLGNTGNPDLTWETTKQINLGIGLSFLEGRLNVEANFYKKNTEDLLLSVPLPDFEGGGSVLQNVGEVSNNGVELDISGYIVRSNKFDWNSSLNFSTNKNKVESLTGDQDEIFVNAAGSNSNSAGAMGVIRVGEPLGLFHGPTFLGTYKSTDDIPSGAEAGDAKYLRDEEGELVLGIIGNGIPDYTIGFNNTLSYGNLDLNFLITSSQGTDILNLNRAFTSMSSGAISNATYGEYRDRWTAENETDIPATGNNFVNSSRYIEDGSFIRLSNIALGYNFNSGFIKGISSFRLYASAQNIFTGTNYSGYDPEVSSTGAASDQGASIDWGAYPNAKTISFGLNIGF